MNWGTVLTVVAFVVIAIVLVMIITMLVGTIRSTRRTPKNKRPENWSHTKDKEFLPWEDDDN
jgi:large-conductance mechanosensitive channel